MHALSILREGLENSYALSHKRRVGALWRSVESLLNGGRLWLTALGRSLSGETNDKHKIKAADRFLGNQKLHADLPLFYRGLAKWLLRGIRRPVLLVDVTGVGPRHLAITVALVFVGRSLPLFSRVYKNQKNARSPKNQKLFIQSLAAVLPPECTPIIVTDAGFHSAWFKATIEQGWDFVGRIRNSTHAKIAEEWIPAKSLHAQATKRTQNIGTVELYKSQPLRLRLVLSKAPKSKGRRRLTLKGAQGRRSVDCKAIRRAREPWLLATSLNEKPKEIVRIYSMRMQIEQAFRDLKSFRHGWCLRHIGSRSPERIEVLLLCAALANVAVLIVGFATEFCKKHYAYYANTNRSRRVLSFFEGVLKLVEKK